jgi:autophagy-related protein 9
MDTNPKYEELKIDSGFYSNVYSYYVRGGYICILVENILQIILIAFTLMFVTFVCFFLDWNLIKLCESEETCKSVSNYIISPNTFHNTSILVCMYIFIIMYSIYWIWISIALINDIYKFRNYKNYFKECLYIKQKEIKTMTWETVVNRIIEYDTELTPEIIVGSIMKKVKENLVILNNQD